MSCMRFLVVASFASPVHLPTWLSLAIFMHSSPKGVVQKPVRLQMEIVSLMQELRVEPFPFHEALMF
eukprot:scaffold99544_cov16-Tisochrysis_lutea.AAC.1